MTPDQILGQAFSGTAGAAGETSDSGLTPEGETIETDQLATSADWITSNLLYATPGTESVAILVVDDFSSDGTDNIPASHGWLVWQVFQQLYDTLPQEATSQIILQQVDIADQQGYRSDLILPELQSAIQDLSEQGIERFVLNMSFVFIPCTDKDLGFNISDFLDARQNNPGRSLVEQLGDDPQYVRSILKDSRIGYIDDTSFAPVDPTAPRGSQELSPTAPATQIPPTPGTAQPAFRAQDLHILQLLNNANLQSDPLRDFLRQQRDVMIVPVASSGNFKQRKPFYPARWPEVISVSANEGNDLRFWLHSNDGDISAPGAWFLFDDDQYRAGTSFAAPVVSLLIAVDLTQPTPQCSIRGNTPVLTHGSYDNQLLGDAVARYC
ncbi:MAG: S8/S53 family peptidase [Anaerolineae bacterium]|nr:S8/S53 family peptidase [Anaerolineae bacterium]